MYTTTAQVKQHAMHLHALCYLATTNLYTPPEGVNYVKPKVRE